MSEIQDWFTLENIKTLAGAAIALRLAVEWTKELFDGVYEHFFKRRPKTLVYAFAWSLFIVYGIGLGGDPRVNVFNAILLTVVAGIMEKPKA